MDSVRLAIVRFGPFELDQRAGELREGARKVVLRNQPLQLLLMLVEQAGEVVTREEIKRKLWPNDTVVEFDHGINTAIRYLRRVLGDNAQTPTYIETVARRGYRLLVPVTRVGVEDSSEEPSSAELSNAVSSRAERRGVERPAVDSDSDAVGKLKVGRLTGKVISHYRVLEVIGGGGMGLVYRAEDLKLGRAVALKFLPEEVGDDPKARERFEREAHAVSTLDHPNICSIYEFDEYEGHPFIVMQLLQGKTLRDHLADGRFRLTQPEGLEVAIQIASGLEAAHEKGIIHRDIKPANIFITEKNVAKILDFGVAKMVEAPDFSPANGGALKGHGFSRAEGAPFHHERGDQSRAGLIPAQDSQDGSLGTPKGVPLQSSSPDDAPKGAPLQDSDSQGAAEAALLQNNEVAAECTPEGVRHPVATTLTRTGMKLGTAGYMSPEQIRGEPLDARTDIFSFGLVLYEMATGERAFTGETEAILHDAIQHRQPKPVREVVPEVPLQLDETIGKCLEKQRERRFQTSRELRELLLDSQNKLVLPSTARIDVVEASAPRRRVWLALALLFITLAAVGAVLSYRRAHQKSKLTDKDTIIFAGWENKTGDPVLDDALPLALRINLGQSPYLGRLSGEKVNRELRQMGRPTTARPIGELMSFEVARQVCLRTNSTAVLYPSISDQGNGYHLVLRAVDCQTGALLASTEAQAPDRSAIVKTLGVIGLLLRAKLGEPDDSLQRFNAPLEQAASPSLEALQAVQQADQIWETQRHPEILALVRHAVELDPNFAIGHLRLGLALSNAAGMDWGSKLAMESLTRAFDLRVRTGQRTRYGIEYIYYAAVTGELNKGEQALLQLRREYLSSIDGSATDYDLSHLHRLMGKWEASISEAEEYRRNNPDTALSYLGLIRGNSALGRLDRAKSASEEAQARGLDAPFLRELRYLVAFLQNDGDGMQEQVAWAEREVDLDLLYDQSDAEAFYGHLRRAQKLSDRVIGLSLRAGDRERAASFRAQVALREAEIGKPNAALEFAYGALSLSSNPGVVTQAATVLARTGRAQEAQKLIDELGRDYPLNDEVQKNWLPSIIAASHLDRDPQIGIRRLEVSYTYELGQSSFQAGNMYPVYMRGLCYLRAGQGQQASVEFQKILDHRGVVYDALIGALAHLQLARAQVMMDDKEAARKSYVDFLTLWKDADPDIPIYQQAKAEYAKLRATGN